MFKDFTLNINTMKQRYYIKFELIEWVCGQLKAAPIHWTGVCGFSQYRVRYLIYAWDGEERGEWVEINRYESSNLNSIEMQVIEGIIAKYEKAVYK